MGSAQLAQRLGYSVSEAAQLAGVSRGTCYNLIREGRLRVVKLRGRTIVPRSALEALLTGPLTDDANSN